MGGVIHACGNMALNLQCEILPGDFVQEETTNLVPGADTCKQIPLEYLCQKEKKTRRNVYSHQNLGMWLTEKKKAMAHSEIQALF